MEQTFFIIKPDAYKFKKEILEEIINEGTFNIISITDKQLKLDDIELIYADEKEPLKSALLQYLSSGIICAGIIEGKNVIDNLSKFSGSFGNPNNCEPSSLRFRYGDKKVHTYENVPVFHNAIHRSITINEAKESIDLYWTKIKHNDIIDDVKKLVISHLDCQERLIYHIEPVVNNAIFLANQLNANSQIVEIASYLHDITRMTGDRENHHISGSELSRDFLTSLNYPLTKTNLICDCILNHRGSKRLTRKTIEENIVASADAMAIIDFPVPLFHAAYNKRQLNMDDGKKFIRDKLTRSWNKIELKVAREAVRNQYESLMGVLK